MDSVIKKLQDLTQSDSGSLSELIEAFAGRYPNQEITLLALKEYARHDGSKRMSEQSIMDILAHVH